MENRSQKRRGARGGELAGPHGRKKRWGIEHEGLAGGVNRLADLAGLVSIRQRVFIGERGRNSGRLHRAAVGVRGQGGWIGECRRGVLVGVKQREDSLRQQGRQRKKGAQAEPTPVGAVPLRWTRSVLVSAHLKKEGSC